jgi:hypothetical protein
MQYVKLSGTETHSSGGRMFGVILLSDPSSDSLLERLRPSLAFGTTARLSRPGRQKLRNRIVRMNENARP